MLLVRNCDHWTPDSPAGSHCTGLVIIRHRFASGNRALAAGEHHRYHVVGELDVELHIARVRARVAAGGHDIPDTKIHARFDQSRLNLIPLLPGLTQLRLFDNSAEGNRGNTFRPKPELIVNMRAGAVDGSMDLSAIPNWAKPIVLAALASTHQTQKLRQ